jgi:dethiobiotin synthetase
LERHNILVVEGAGGVFVPIKKDFFFADLIKAWNIPVIIVARLGLGTINHTLLTHTVLQSKGIKVLGVILNDTEGVKGLAAETNPEMLREYLNVPLFGVFPHAKAVLNGAMNREALAETFAVNIDTQAILDQLEG